VTQTYSPADLADKTTTWIANELFGMEAQTAWWSLSRRDEKTMLWQERRLAVALEASHGFLVGLHEVGTPGVSIVVASRDLFLPKGTLAAVVEGRGWWGGGGGAGGRGRLTSCG